MGSEPKHDDAEGPQPVDLPRFLLQLLEGNLGTAEELSKLADKFVSLANTSMKVAWLMLAAVGIFLLGQITGLIAALIRVGMIG